MNIQPAEKCDATAVHRCAGRGTMHSTDSPWDTSHWKHLDIRGQPAEPVLLWITRPLLPRSGGPFHKTEDMTRSRNHRNQKPAQDQQGFFHEGKSPPNVAARRAERCRGRHGASCVSPVHGRAEPAYQAIVTHRTSRVAEPGCAVPQHILWPGGTVLDDAQHCRGQGVRILWGYQ